MCVCNDVIGRKPGINYICIYFRMKDSFDMLFRAKYKMNWFLTIFNLVENFENVAMVHYYFGFVRCYCHVTLNSVKNEVRNIGQIMYKRRKHVLI